MSSCNVLQQGMSKEGMVIPQELVVRLVFYCISSLKYQSTSGSAGNPAPVEEAGQDLGVQQAENDDNAASAALDVQVVSQENQQDTVEFSMQVE